MKTEIKDKILKYVDEKYKGSLKSLRDTNLSKFLTPEDINLIRNTISLELQDKTSLMIFCFLNDISEQPKCPCGNIVEFDQVRKRFRPYCSVRCQRTLYGQTVEKRTNTCMERYGSRSYMGSKEGIERTKQVCLEKYGVDNYSKTEEFKKLRKEW